MCDFNELRESGPGDLGISLSYEHLKYFPLRKIHIGATEVLRISLIVNIDPTVAQRA